VTRARFPKLQRLRREPELAARLAELSIELPRDAELESGPTAPLAQPLDIVDGSAGRLRVGNRFTALPMEGWDAGRDGGPTELLARRWRRIGAGGAKLVWCEATAVRADGRANPNQLLIHASTLDALAELRRTLVCEHERVVGSSHDLVVGLQLTHSGRWSRPDGEPAPRIAYRHALLDRRARVESDDAVLSDAELDELVDCYVAASELAYRAGFQFVDVKHCHGYLLHELLSARERPGRYGGDLTSRTRFLRSVASRVRERVPGLALAVRLSAFDLVPFRAGSDGAGEPEATAPYANAFGGDGSGTGIDLGEPRALLDLLVELGIGLVNVTGGSPYYCPHAQRPAFYPPSDGYEPPEDPLVGVARLLDVTAQLKQSHPGLTLVGSGYSYLQEWLPHVAQRAVRGGRVDSVGLGRMLLSYPELPLDVLAGRALERQSICRTFSDCTTAPRNGLVSGCYPLDPLYRERPERRALAAAKGRAAAAARGET
jgi:2,4-dienoyl-CoA reductase-like NADH-dependent reductase (Old Yellow Enzyme family)